MASADAGHARDGFRAGFLLSMVHADDPSARRDREYARRAAEALPDALEARYLLAFTRVDDAARSEELDENPRRQDYEAILARDPEHVEALRSLAEIELQSTGTPEPALALLDRALARAPGFAPARILRARALATLELGALARQEYRIAAAAGDADPSPLALATYADALIRDGEWRAASRTIDRQLRTASASPADLARIASIQLRTGMASDAVRTLERTIERFPFARDPRSRLARFFEARDDFDRAREILDGWLSLCPEDDDALVDLARLHGRAQDTERQIEALRDAVELNPNLERERRRLEFLQGDVVPFFAGFRIETLPDVFDTPSPEAAATENDPFYVLLEHDVVRAYRNGTTSRYHHRIVRILSETGARELSTFGVPHAWGDQSARLLEARVVRADGTEIEPRIMRSWVRLPSLRPGDHVELRYRIDDRAPTFFGDYFGLVHRFGSEDGSASRRAILDLVLEPGRDYRIQRKNGAPEPLATREAEDGSVVHHFEMEDLPRRHIELAMPEIDEREPLLRVTTYPDWSAFANWWWNLIRKQSSMTPAMRAKVAELTAGVEDDVARIDAIYRFVTTDVRYKAWEFGVHGYQPYTTPVIFERRHGDCKDKALLLNVMLGEVGIEAYPVLIQADPLRSHDDLELPMVEHFNHCISYLPASGDRPAMFLDGTAVYHPIDTLPEMDQGADVLVVRPTEGDIETVPWARADANRDARTYDVHLEADGSARVVLVHEPSGNAAVQVREALGNEPAKRRERIQRELAARFGSVEVVRVDTSDLLDLSEPVRVEVEFRCAQLARPEVGGAGLQLPAGLAPASLRERVAATSRQFALLLGAPRSNAQTVRYHLPPGFEPAAGALPEPVDLDAGFGSYASTWSRNADGTLQLDRVRSHATNRVEPEEYPALREFAGRVDEADERAVLIRRKS